MIFMRPPPAPTHTCARARTCATPAAECLGHPVIRARPLLASVVRDSVGLSSENPDERGVLSVQPSDHAPVLAVYRCSSSLTSTSNTAELESYPEDSLKS